MVVMNYAVLFAPMHMVTDAVANGYLFDWVELGH